MKLVLTRLLLLVFAFANVPAMSQEDILWIVTGDDAAASFAKSLGAQYDKAQVDSVFNVVETRNGRIVAALDPSVEELLQQTIHTEHHRCGGYTLHPTREEAISEADNPYYSTNYVEQPNLFPRKLDQQAHVRPALNRVDKARIAQTINRLQGFATRYYQSDKAQAAAREIERRWKSYGVGRNDFSVALRGHSWRQSSVIATIRGSEIPDEIVVIGGHLDSINTRNQSAAPGADDDGSGIAVVSEVLRVMLESGYRPKRTLQFIAYAAEEVGLRGSREIAQAYSDTGKRVIAALQLDMTGYMGSAKNIYFVTDYTSVNLTDFLKDLIREYHGPGPHHITYGETKCGYACSDHVAWTGVGVPAAFPFEARFSDYNKKIHTENDIMANIDSSGTNQARFAKLGVAFLMELGKSAGATPTPQKDRYIYTTLRVITSKSTRGCRVNDWSCMSRLCERDLGSSAWRGWAGCWRSGSRFMCNFECGVIRRMQ